MDKWIPVSERLPEEDGRYLTYIVNENDNDYQYIMVCEFLIRRDRFYEYHFGKERITYDWFPDDDCASSNVVAWMPLPEPYDYDGEKQSGS